MSRLKRVRPSQGLGAFGLTMNTFTSGGLLPSMMTPVAPAPAPLTVVPAPTPLVSLQPSATIQTLAQNATVDQLKTLPSPTKEVAVATAIVQGRPDVIQAAATQLSPSQVASLPSPAPQIIASAKAGQFSTGAANVVDTSQMSTALQTQVAQQATAQIASATGTPQWGVDLQSQQAALGNFYNTLGDTVSSLVKGQAQLTAAVQTLNANFGTLAGNLDKVASVAQMAAAQKVDLAPINDALSRHEAALNQIITQFVAAFGNIENVIKANIAKITGAR